MYHLKLGPDACPPTGAHHDCCKCASHAAGVDPEQGIEEDPEAGVEDVGIAHLASQMALGGSAPSAPSRLVGRPCESEPFLVCPQGPSVSALAHALRGIVIGHLQLCFSCTASVWVHQVVLRGVRTPKHVADERAVTWTALCCAVQAQGTADPDLDEDDELECLEVTPLYTLKAPCL